MSENEVPYHIPALLSETLEGLNIDPKGVYVDVTFGGGGHSKAILERLGNDGILVGFDQDLDALRNVPDDDRFIFVRSNFRYLSNFLRYHDIEEIDGLLADLGVSSHHFDEADRGFSFRFEGALDMRMNRSAETSAETVLSTYSETQLADLFYYYGELKNSRKIANVIVKERAVNPIRTTTQLVDLLRPLINRKQEKKELAQVFQALRIEVNNEMDTLKEMIEQAVRRLKPGGRIAVITYHSLEDRLIKNFFKSGNFEGKIEQDFYGNVQAPLKPLKLIVPSDEEVDRNPRARSAKLRIGVKI